MYPQPINGIDQIKVDVRAQQPREPYAHQLLKCNVILTVRCNEYVLRTDCQNKEKQNRTENCIVHQIVLQKFIPLNFLKTWNDSAS